MAEIGLQLSTQPFTILPFVLSETAVSRSDYATGNGAPQMPLDAQVTLQALDAALESARQVAGILKDLLEDAARGAAWTVERTPARTACLPFSLGLVEPRVPALVRDVQARVRVHLLGRFQVEVDGCSLGQWRSRRARQLFAYLALNRKNDLSRERLMGLFWPDHSEERAENNLSLAVMNLRRLLSVSGDGSDFIVLRAGCYYLDADNFWLDTEEFATAASTGLRLEAEGDFAAAAQALDAAIEAYVGDLLPAEPYEEWTLSARRELLERFAQALRARARLARAGRDYDLSIRLRQRLLDLDPAEEESHRQLVQDFLQTGQRSRALAQMEACRQALRRYLDAGPSRETQLLFATIAGRDA